MSLLDLCPRGSLLEPVQEAVTDTDWSPFAKQLYEGLTVPQREVWDDECRFKLLCSGRRFGKTYLCISQSGRMGNRTPWHPELVRHPELQVSQTDRLASAQDHGAARDVRQEERI